MQHVSELLDDEVLIGCKYGSLIAVITEDGTIYTIKGVEYDGESDTCWIKVEEF